MKGWDKDEAQKWSVIITVITNCGAMTGALFSGAFTKYGKMKMILVLDVILLAVIGICMINDIVVIAFGRFFWGLCAGSLSVMCPKYLNEFLPIEKKGTYGALNQLMCTIGIMFPSCMSLAIPRDPVADIKVKPDDFLITGYWRLIWLAAAAFTIVQMLLLIFVFNYESPVDLLKSGQDDKLEELFMKMYGTDEAVQQRKQALQAGQDQGSEGSMGYC